MIDRVVRVEELPRAGETLAALSSATFPGGKGANQAAAAAMCGARVRMLGRTGVDGAFIVDALRYAGVETSSIETNDATSGAAIVMVNHRGENAIVIAKESNTRISLIDVEEFLTPATTGDIVLLQNECALLAETIAHASARGLRVWLNAAPADDSLRVIAFEKLAGLVVNETEAHALTGEVDPPRALELLSERMPSGIVIITLGASGAIAASGRERHAHAGFVVNARDTVGCGDAFVGAFLAAIAEGIDMPRALTRANAAGALSAMREGAIPSLPSRAEVDAAAQLPAGTRLAPRPPKAVPSHNPQPCRNCGYDLAGNTAAMRCPECGAKVQSFKRSGPAWLQAEPLTRVVLGARIVSIVTVALMAVPMLQLLGMFIVPRVWPARSAWEVTGVAFLIAMFAQIVGQAVGTWMIAVPLLDGSRRVWLRALLLVRAILLLPLALVFLTAITAALGAQGSLPLLDMSYMKGVLFSGGILIVPLGLLVAFGCDIAVMRMVKSLVTDTGVTVPSGVSIRAEVMRIFMWIVLPLSLFTFWWGGFLLVPIVWVVALIYTHNELRDAARLALKREEAR
jgi:ribokinase